MKYDTTEWYELHGKDTGYATDGWFIVYDKSNGKLGLEVNSEYGIELDNDSIVMMYSILKKYCEGKQ